LTILRSSGCFAAAPLRLIPDRTLMPFADLGLSDPLLRAVAEAGYDEPTPIQKGTIPPVLMGKDIIGIAQTGTGKTAAFVLPMIDILGEGRSRARMPRSLILEPTRRSPRISRNTASITSFRWRC
jgi:superfamily II DNA/RNA helicase